MCFLSVLPSVFQRRLIDYDFSRSDEAVELSSELENMPKKVEIILATRSTVIAFAANQCTHENRSTDSPHGVFTCWAFRHPTISIRERFCSRRVHKRIQFAKFLTGMSAWADASTVGSHCAGKLAGRLLFGYAFRAIRHQGHANRESSGSVESAYVRFALHQLEPGRVACDLNQANLPAHQTTPRSCVTSGCGIDCGIRQISIRLSPSQLDCQ